MRVRRFECSSVAAGRTAALSGVTGLPKTMGTDRNRTAAPSHAAGCAQPTHSLVAPTAQLPLVRASRNPFAAAVWHVLARLLARVAARRLGRSIECPCVRAAVSGTTARGVAVPLRTIKMISSGGLWGSLRSPSSASLAGRSLVASDARFRMWNGIQSAKSSLS